MSELCLGDRGLVVGAGGGADLDLEVGDALVLQGFLDLRNAHLAGHSVDLELQFSHV